MDTIYKIFENVEVKKVGERQYEFTASTADMDRDGEVIDVEGWDLRNFKKNPVIMYAHDYRTLPIGKAAHIGVKDGKLKNTVEFPPEGTYEFADIVERLVNTGYLKTESVGFIPKKWEDGDGGEKTPRRTYTKQELLEISIVPIPSNPHALMDAVEDGVITTKQFEAITKPEEPKVIEESIDNAITKPEETDEFIRIPVRTCEVTATIDISKKEGISALYCGKEKQVRTYLFRKDHGWTMAKAKAWVKEHEGKKFDPDEDIEIKSVIPYHKYPLDETGEWDAAREVAKADVDDLKKMCTIIVGDPENKTSYKLPHHKADGYTTVWRGVAACAAVLMGARGGVDAPASDIAGAKSHIKRHYADFDKGEPPWEKAVSQKEIIDEIDYLTILIKENGMGNDVKESALEFSQKVIVQLKDEIPEDMSKLIMAIGAKNLGYGAPIEHWDKGSDGKFIMGLDLRIPGSDIPVDIEKEETITYQEIRDAIKRLSK